MTTISFFDNLPVELRESVEDFQGRIVREYLAKSDKWHNARQLIETIAEHLVKATGRKKLPVDLAGVAKMLNVTLQPSMKINESVCGSLIPCEGGFDAKIAADQDRWPNLTPRQRFTIAHELGHVFFYHLKTRIPERLIPPLTVYGRNNWYKEEGLCDAFASALLIPENAARLIAKDESVGIDVVIEESRRLGVTPSVLVKRIVHAVKGWPRSVFYSIRINSGEPKVFIYRGEKRKVADAKAPARAVVEGIVKHKSVDEAISALCDHGAFIDASISKYQKSGIWIKVDQWSQSHMRL